ncbi:tetratricopeptide repeat protein [Brevibacillus agri]|uniref:tetratricopeptide repeat protein n=1 Tax=Brevibacillus agri TaxID=51101 RepID=UPI003D263278
MSFWKKVFGLKNKEQTEIFPSTSQSSHKPSNITYESSINTLSNTGEPVTDQERKEITDFVSKLEIPKASIMGVELDMKEMLTNVLIEQYENEKNGISPPPLKDIDISDNWLRIRSLDFFGKGCYSGDGNLFVAGGMDGTILLVDEDKQEIILTINDVIGVSYPGPVVSNNGTIMFFINKEGLQCHLFIISKDGNILIDGIINANVYNYSISDCGRYAICQMASNLNHDEGDKLFTFDVINRCVIASWYPETGRASSYSFDIESYSVTFHYNDGLEYRYLLSGELVDEEKWRTERLKTASGYKLESIGFKLLDEINSTSPSSISDYNEVFELFEAACNKMISSNHKANMCKSIGEIYLKYDMKAEAITAYKKAIGYNPKIGLKRIVASLEKEIS